MKRFRRKKIRSGEARSAGREGEKLWAAEIRERVRAFQAGELKVIPWEEALAEAEELLR
jgi:Putative addiction module component